VQLAITDGRVLQGPRPRKLNSYWHPARRVNHSALLTGRLLIFPGSGVGADQAAAGYPERVRGVKELVHSGI
jgi:hypothetical protein